MRHALCSKRGHTREHNPPCSPRIASFERFFVESDNAFKAQRAAPARAQGKRRGEAASVALGSEPTRSASLKRVSVAKGDAPRAIEVAAPGGFDADCSSINRTRRPSLNSDAAEQRAMVVRPKAHAEGVAAGSDAGPAQRIL